jgi:hypothetical protein
MPKKLLTLIAANLARQVISRALSGFPLMVQVAQALAYALIAPDCTDVRKKSTKKLRPSSLLQPEL